MTRFLSNPMLQSCCESSPVPGLSFHHPRNRNSYRADSPFSHRPDRQAVPWSPQPSAAGARKAFQVERELPSEPEREQRNDPYHSQGQCHGLVCSEFVRFRTIRSDSGARARACSVDDIGQTHVASVLSMKASSKEKPELVLGLTVPNPVCLSNAGI
jgi:hypothetical protein